MRGRHLVLVVASCIMPWRQVLWARWMIRSFTRKGGCYFPFIAQLGLQLGWFQVKDDNVKRVRVGARVWWRYPPSLDVSSDLFLGLGGCILADCDGQCQDSSGEGSHSKSWSLSPGPHSSWLKQHLPSGFFNVIWYFQWVGAIYWGIVLCILWRQDLGLTTINNYHIVQGMKKWDFVLSIF